MNAGSRDNHLWLQCWRDGSGDFHQPATNTLLTRFWPGLNLPAGSRVFVPLCGKSLDMLWLAQQGHQVIGVELSPVAVAAFFEENALLVSKRRVGKFTLWESGDIAILCGDYFSLRTRDVGVIDSVYDRAALTALPADIRKRYIAHQRSLLTSDCRIFLLTIEDAEIGDTPVQALGVDREIAALYDGTHAIDLEYVESVMEGDPEQPAVSRRAEYKVYYMSGK